jgi:hypothetical protein
VPLKPAQRQTDVLRKFLTRHAGRGLTQRGTYVFQEVHVVDTEVVFGRLVHRIRLHKQREDRCSPGNANDYSVPVAGRSSVDWLSFAAGALLVAAPVTSDMVLNTAFALVPSDVDDAAGAAGATPLLEASAALSSSCVSVSVARGSGGGVRTTFPRCE